MTATDTFILVGLLAGGALLMRAMQRQHRRCMCHRRLFPNVAERVAHERKGYRS